MNKLNRFGITLISVLLIFLLMNIIASIQAYKFTHFSTSVSVKTPRPDHLFWYEKLRILVLGIENPRPTCNFMPECCFKSVVLKSNVKISGWLISHNDSLNKRGTVIICHGYGGGKSAMLDKANEFFKLGFNCFLFDFMGSGESEGNQTTIGFKEAEQVKSAYDYIQATGEKHIYLFGTSMGAVAIMKSIGDYSLNPEKIILECPFGSMYETVSARFHNMHIPSIPMAGILVFWGGLENGFWAFHHNPVQYALKIKCPVLLLYGEKDKNVSRKEIDQIYSSLRGVKELKTFPLAGHENYLIRYKLQWIKDISAFLSESETR